ncbi:hypothetical protein FQR65_LT08520 [Abscondita terminalis]|nr:hypothetical protein FQR65_LT08520 [Abscondita terminalis]
MNKVLNLCIVFSFFYFSDGDLNESSLKLVHVIFRHGTRIPDEHELYPNDPYKTLFHNKFGQLTNKGKQNSYQLGKILRNRYNDFLGEKFHLNHVLATSTDTDRTKMTASLVLAGLFPPSESDKWSDELNWIPIPVAYKDIDYELARPNDYCPAYQLELNRILNSQDVLNLLNKYNSTLEVLSRNSGIIYKTLRDVFLFHQLLISEQDMNLVLPKWATDEYKSIKYLATMQCYYENSNPILKKLNGGRILSKIIKNMKGKISNSLKPLDRKIFLYSGHDNNIVNILSALQLYNFHFPQFNAAVLIELHQYPNFKDHYVKVFYLEDVHSQPKAQFLKDCGYWCTFDKFIDLMSLHLPLNYTKECGSDLGRQQSVQLGQKLRNRYKSFLSKDYNPDEVYTLSTDYNRTRETAQLVLNGIYSKSTTAPYIVHWKKRVEDYELRHPIDYCSAFVNEVNSVKNSDPYQLQKIKYENVFKIINEKTGKTYNEILDAFFLFQVLYSEKYLNLTSSDWVSDVYKTLNELSDFQLHSECSTSKLKRLNGGISLKNVIKNMKRKVTNSLIPNNRKIFLYSAHDVNVVNIFAVMNVFKAHFPNYNAATIIELHHNNKSEKYFVKLFYIKHVNEEATEMFIKDCGNPCEFNKFEEIMLPYLSKNHTQECESKILFEDDQE